MSDDKFTYYKVIGFSMDLPVIQKVEIDSDNVIDLEGDHETGALEFMEQGAGGWDHDANAPGDLLHIGYVSHAHAKIAAMKELQEAYEKAKEQVERTYDA